MELGGIFGTVNTPEEAKHLGIGSRPRVVSQQGRGRFRSAPCALGLLGQRVTWALQSLHLAELHGRAIVEGRGGNGAKGDILCRIGHRARAFHREGGGRVARDEDYPNVQATLGAAYKLLTSLMRTCHGAPPLLAQWALGNGRGALDKIHSLAEELNALNEKKGGPRGQRIRSSKSQRKFARR